MSSPPVTYAVDAGVATLALDRPDARNALSDETLDALLAALERARDDERVRVVVLASTHPRVFSSGGDLRGFAADLGPEARRAALDRFPRVFSALAALGKPTICAAHGHVLAGALGLALACDLVVASQDARFGTPELDVGLFPFMVSALLARDIPRKKATELLLLGQLVDAREAERIGLVNRVVPVEEHAAAVREWAQRLAGHSPVAMRLGKEALRRQRDLAPEAALEAMRDALADALETQDAQEGIAAFLQKRRPEWTGR